MLFFGNIVKMFLSPRLFHLCISKRIKLTLKRKAYGFIAHLSPLSPSPTRVSHWLLKKGSFSWYQKGRVDINSGWIHFLATCFTLFIYMITKQTSTLRSRYSKMGSFQSSIWMKTSILDVISFFLHENSNQIFHVLEWRPCMWVTVWNSIGSELSSKLQRLQNRAARIITGAR